MNRKILLSTFFVVPMLFVSTSEAITCIKPSQCGPLDPSATYECAERFIKISNINYVNDSDNLINNTPRLNEEAALKTPQINYHDGIISYNTLIIKGFASAISQSGFGHSQTPSSGSPSCDQYIATITGKQLFRIELTAKNQSNRKVIIKSDTILYTTGGFSPTLGGCIIGTNVANDKGIYYDLQVPKEYKDIRIEYIPIDSTIMNGSNPIKFSGLNQERNTYLELRPINR
jgi:hypothetical protein